MNFDRGYISPYMITNTEKMEAVLEDPYILISDKKISLLVKFFPYWKRWFKPGNPCS